MNQELHSTEIACRTCGLVHDLPPVPTGRIALCGRCGSRLAKRTVGSLHLTAAFSLAALILYIPANIFPILRLDMYGASTENTVWEGCRLLYQDGDIVVAAIVFLASIFIPLLKLAGLLILVGCTVFHVRGGRLLRTRIYRFIEVIGRWAMLDVFVLAVLVSLVKLRRLATIIPGPGLFAFALVVVFTICASASFDPQHIWLDAQEEEES